MAESAAHARLRHALMDWVLENHGADIGATALIDSPETQSGNSPPVVGGFIPDLYLCTPSKKQLIIGEAKTPNDIETRHSREQYAAYLQHLSFYPDSTFVMAVPWYVVNQAKSLIWSLQKRTNASGVKLVFLEKLPG